MDGQLNIFDILDSQNGFCRCMNCEHCHHTDIFKDYVDSKGVSHFLAYCNVKRSVITESTGSWLCHNENYIRKYILK